MTQLKPNVAAFIGVDVAKEELVVARHGESTSRKIKNTPCAINTWLKSLPDEAHIGMESTGGYCRPLADLAHQAGLTVYLLNPRDVRHYGDAVGKRAKTDPTDALLIARYIAHERADLHPWQPPTKAQALLDDLLKRRATVVKAQGMLRQTLADFTPLGDESKAMLDAVAKMIAAIDRQLEQTLASSPSLQAQAQCVRSVPGIGLLTGAALINLFSRLPTARADAIVAFTGLDPRPRDSGKKTGVRRLSKRGPGELRRLIFNAAMSAARTQVWNPFYWRERNKGLSSTAALIALARKLIRIAFALFRKNANFNPKIVKCL